MRVVVITGAASGIGRATALEFARRGDSVVVASRREDALDELARECLRIGATRALAVPTDVTDEASVEALARQVLDEFEGIDVWVNAASVVLFAKFEDAPSHVYRRVIETNLFGYIHSARAVVPLFKEQGRGILINIDSGVAGAPQPYTSAYVASKAAVRSLFECVRMELVLEKHKHIHICNVMPSAVDTPFFQHAANYTGRAPRALNPTYSPEKVAKTICRLADHPRREVTVGMPAKFGVAFRNAAPAAYERLTARYYDFDYFQKKRATDTEGNLFNPMPEQAKIHGGWRVSPARRAVGWGIAGGVIAGALIVVLRSQKSER